MTTTIVATLFPWQTLPPPPLNVFAHFPKGEFVPWRVADRPLIPLGAGTRIKVLGLIHEPFLATIGKEKSRDDQWAIYYLYHNLVNLSYTISMPPDWAEPSTLIPSISLWSRFTRRSSLPGTLSGDHPLSSDDLYWEYSGVIPAGDREFPEMRCLNNNRLSPTTAKERTWPSFTSKAYKEKETGGKLVKGQRQMTGDMGEVRLIPITFRWATCTADANTHAPSSTINTDSTHRWTVDMVNDTAGAVCEKMDEDDSVGTECEGMDGDDDDTNTIVPGAGEEDDEEDDDEDEDEVYSDEDADYDDEDDGHTLVPGAYYLD
jgi:hypothetical protein